jgi:hypothetical protein
MRAILSDPLHVQGFQSLQEYYARHATPRAIECTDVKIFDKFCVFEYTIYTSESRDQEMYTCCRAIFDILYHQILLPRIRFQQSDIDDYPLTRDKMTLVAEVDNVHQ